MTKNNERTLTYIRTFWPIFLFILATVGGAYFTLDHKINANENAYIEMRGDIKRIDENVSRLMLESRTATNAILNKLNERNQ